MTSPRIRRRLAVVLGVSVLLTSACATACASEGNAGDEGAPGEVIATTSQIGALTLEVTRETGIEVHTLLAPGVNPHDYEPSPSEVALIGDATLVLRHGIGLDDFLDAAIEGAGADRVVTVTEGIDLRPASREHEDTEHGDTEHEDEDDHNHGDGDADPHVWHDPQRVQVMVANIADALVEAFPEQAEALQANADAYHSRLDEVDAEIRALIDSIPAEHRKVVSAHDSLGYFLDRYGLEFVGAVVPSTASGAEASVRALADLQALIQAEDVRAIFAENSADPAVVEQLAEDTGVRVVTDLYGDTLGPTGSDASTVDGMLLHNASRIAEALR